MWIEPDGHGEISDGIVEFALSEVGLAASPDGNSESGIEPDRLAVVSYGAVIIVLVYVSVPAIIEGKDISGIEPDRLVVIGDGAIEPRLLKATAFLGSS